MFKTDINLIVFSKLFKKKEINVPTILGWFLLCGIVVTLLLIFVINIYSFLAYHNPVKAEVLIVEGWVPDYALEKAVYEFNYGKYGLIITTGGPLLEGSYLSHYKTFAELTAASLKKLGVPKDKIIALPSAYVFKDRTYASALEVNKWLLKHPNLKTINLFTMGVHARRSYLLFKKALSSKIKLGVIVVASKDYNPEKWWSSSSGVRTVISEQIAYIYIRYLWFFSR